MNGAGLPYYKSYQELTFQRTRSSFVIICLLHDVLQLQSDSTR